MLLSKGIITQDLVSMLLTWHHSGFNVLCGPRIQPGDDQAMENLARYIIRASFSQERMTYIPEEAKVIYQSKDGKKTKVFNALGWPRQKATGCKHWLPWPHMCRTGVNPAESGSQIWSLSASGGAIIVMFHEASGKKKIRLC
jgi:hypothetical protein